MKGRRGKRRCSCVLVCSAVARIKVLSFGPLPRSAASSSAVCYYTPLCGSSCCLYCSWEPSSQCGQPSEEFAVYVWKRRPALHGTDYCDDEFCLLCAAEAIIKARHKSKEKRFLSAHRSRPRADGRILSGGARGKASGQRNSSGRLSSPIISPVSTGGSW